MSCDISSSRSSRQAFGAVELLLLGRVLAADFAEFALEGERTAAGLLAAADGVSVVADAVRQQEVQVGMLRREALGCCAVFGDVAARQTRKKVRRSEAEPVRQRRTSVSFAVMPSPCGEADQQFAGRLVFASG
jgi:hypothetical protein